MTHATQSNGAAKQELLKGAQPQQRPGDRMARQMGEGLAGAQRLLILVDPGLCLGVLHCSCVACNAGHTCQLVVHCGPHAWRLTLMKNNVA